MPTQESIRRRLEADAAAAKLNVRPGAFLVMGDGFGPLTPKEYFAEWNRGHASVWGVVF